MDQRLLLLEADARRIGQRDAPAFHPGVVGEAAEGREDLRIGLVAAELQAGGDVQRELMPAMRHHVAAGEAMVAEQGEGAQVFHQTVAERAVELQPVAVRTHARSEEHTSELQSLMRISYAVFCM